MSKALGQKGRGLFGDRVSGLKAVRATTVAASCGILRDRYSVDNGLPIRRFMLGAFFVGFFLSLQVSRLLSFHRRLLHH